MSPPSGEQREPPADDELLVRFLSRALERREAGEAVDPAAICAGHPHLVAPLADALGLAAAVPKLGGRADPMLGRLLGGRYELTDRLGAGAMGAVYGATDRELRRRVAVKVMAPAFGERPYQAERFAREAEVLASLHHPNVVPVHDRGTTDDGTPYLVMECLAGCSLGDILQEAAERAETGGPESLVDTGWIAERLGSELGEASYLRLVVTWCADIAAGLAAAHEAGVFHRDVKPSNVFVSGAGVPVLLDFGIAARPEDPTLTVGESGVGTPWYMAPEQLAGDAAPNPTIDVYGLAATLYHLVTLRPPYVSTGPRLVLQIQTEDPTPAAKVRAGLPIDLQAILDRGLERDPRRRYQSAAAFGADLRAFLDFRPVAARPLAGWQRAWRRLRRRPGKTAALVSAPVAVLAVAVALPLWLDKNVQERRAAVAARWARVPVTFTFERHRVGHLAASAEWAASIAHLEEILARDPRHAGALTLRANAALDRGELDVARRLVARLAELEGTPYLQAVARAYRRATGPGIDGLDLAAVGEPRTSLEHFVAAVHAIRRADFAGAQRAAAAADDLPVARELRALMLQVRGEHLRAYELALALGRQLPRPSIRTLHVVAAAQTSMQRYDDAVPHLQAMLAIRDDIFDPHQNLGLVYQQLYEDELAHRHLVTAHRLRPWSWRALDRLARLTASTAVSRIGFDQALDWARKIGDEGHRLRAVAGVLTRRAQFLADRRAADAAEAAAEALEWHAKLAARSDSRQQRAVRGLLRTIADGTLQERGYTYYLELLASADCDARADLARDLVNLSLLLPAQLSAEDVERIVAVFRKVAAVLDPADPQVRALPEGGK